MVKVTFTKPMAQFGNQKEIVCYYANKTNWGVTYIQKTILHQMLSIPSDLVSSISESKERNSLQIQKVTLDKLEEAGVFKVRLSEDEKHLTFTEMCDENSQSHLDRKEVQQLISELHQLLNLMK